MSTADPNGPLPPPDDPSGPSQPPDDPSDLFEKLSDIEKERIERLQAANLERFHAFAREFHTETDRAAVILGAAKLDELLRELVEKALLPRAETRTDELLGGDDGGDKPLSTFSSRIDTAYRLGLIAPRERRSLHLVRKIRNKFAHRVTTASLSDSPYREWIRDLHRPIPSETFWETITQREYGDERSPRVKFRTIVAVYAGVLELSLVNVQRIPSQFVPQMP